MMKPNHQLKVDAYSHIVPPKYAKVLSKIVPEKMGVTH